jgi:hypothetical protein
MFFGLLARQRIATKQAFFPFACLMAQQHNLSPNIKHDRTMSPADYMPTEIKRRPKSKQGAIKVEGALGGDIFAQFAKGATHA